MCGPFEVNSSGSWLGRQWNMAVWATCFCIVVWVSVGLRFKTWASRAEFRAKLAPEVLQETSPLSLESFDTVSLAFLRLSLLTHPMWLLVINLRELDVRFRLFLSLTSPFLTSFGALWSAIFYFCIGQIRTNSIKSWGMSRCAKELWNIALT